MSYLPLPEKGGKEGIFMKHGFPIRIKFLKFIFIVVLVLTFFIPIHLSAQEAKYPWEKHKNDNDSVLLKKHTFELGPEISYITYKEPDVMKDKGMMYGLVGSYTYHNKLMLKAEGRGSWGKVDYSNSGEINNITDYMLEFRGLCGYDFPILKTSTMTPYIGIGYRYLNDDSAGKISTTGAWGYERESNYIYSPLGMTFVIDLGNKWLTVETIEYDLFWWGKQKSHLSDVDLGYNDISNRQKKGYGLRGSLTLQKKGEKIDIEVGPFIRYWHIQKSETETWTYYGIPIGYGLEPKNKSTEIGIMGIVKF